MIAEVSRLEENAKKGEERESSSLGAFQLGPPQRLQQQNPQIYKYTIYNTIQGDSGNESQKAQKMS